MKSIHFKCVLRKNLAPVYHFLKFLKRCFPTSLDTQVKTKSVEHDNLQRSQFVEGNLFFYMISVLKLYISFPLKRNNLKKYKVSSDLVYLLKYRNKIIVKPNITTVLAGLLWRFSEVES